MTLITLVTLQAVTFQTTEEVMKSWPVFAPGQMAFALDAEKLYIRVTRGWRLIQVRMCRTQESGHLLSSCKFLLEKSLKVL